MTILALLESTTKKIGGNFSTAAFDYIDGSTDVIGRNSTPDDDDFRSKSLSAWQLVTSGVLPSLVILFTLVGNSLVVLAVASTRRLRSSVTNYFVVSLAVADLTVAVLVMPYAVLYELYGRWTFGWVFCYFWISCDVTCCTASILHLCVISFDRYLAVTEPLTYRSRMSKRRALAAVAGVWTCSSAISFVPIYAGWFVDGGSSGNGTRPVMPLYEDGPVCGLYVNPTYAVISSSTSFYLPLVVMLVLYAKIFRIARRQAAEIRQLEKSLQAAKRAPTGRLQRRSRRVTSDTKAVKTLGTLMGLFCVSWLPFFVLYLIKPFCADACPIPVAVDTVVTWLGYCNSFINPCVYAFLNRDFRSAFQRVILCGSRLPPTSLPSFVSSRRRSVMTSSALATNATSTRTLIVNGGGGGREPETHSPLAGRTSPSLLPSGGVSVRLKILRLAPDTAETESDWTSAGFCLASEKSDDDLTTPNDVFSL